MLMKSIVVATFVASAIGPWHQMTAAAFMPPKNLRMPRAFVSTPSTPKASSSSASSTTLKVSLEDAKATEYDYIVVGMGYAGSIMTARLAERAPDKKILAIDYGGPVQAATGGAEMDNVTIQFTATDFQKAAEGETGDYSPDDPLTMADVPGNYNNVAFRPLTDDYQLPEFPSCFQGIGLGGNGVYNGALYQEPADWWWNYASYDDVFVSDKYPAGTKNSDVMAPYIAKVRQELSDGIHAAPSSDNVHYNHGLYDLVKPYLNDADFKEYKSFPPNKPLYNLNDVNDRFYMVPAVNTKNAVRTGPSHWLQKVIDSKGNVKEEYSNLDVLYYTAVERAVLTDTVATGVKVSFPSKAEIGGLDPSTGLESPKEEIINVKTGGKVIFTAGTLPTTRLLYNSGVGCEVLRKKVVPYRTSAFDVDNPAIGVAIHEHVTTSLGMRHTGEDKPQPNTIHFDPGDFNSPTNIGHVKDYTLSRKGPFTQYGPVVASHFLANMDLIKDTDYYHELPSDLPVSTELFYNPFGLGPYPPASNKGLNPYNGAGTFGIYVMLLRPYQRGLFRLKKDGTTAEYVQVYLNSYYSEDAMPSEEERSTLQIPYNYADLGRKDIGVMAASVMEVLEITKDASDIEVAMGPGDGTTEYISAYLDNGKGVPIKSLDPTKPEQVIGFVDTYDNQEYVRFNVNGEFLPITRLQENHYCSGAPLARSKDVWGQPLGSRASSYGVDPDSLEVRGTSNLLVADASLFPETVYCHPIGAIMALAEWAADIVHPE